MSDQRAHSGVAFLCTLALAGGVWLLLDAGTCSESTEQLDPPRVAESPPPIPPEHMPPPFGDRMIRKPDPMEPAASQTAAFCADENWSRMDVRVSPGEAGEFRVDPALWNRRLTSTRAGIASWMSLCKGDGQAVRIVAADSGVLLATYDASSGLREP